MLGRIPLGQNIHSKSGVVTDGTYIGFMILTFCGAALAWALVDARQVQRADGSRVVLMKNPSWQSELLGLWETLRTDTWVVFLFPMFFASNWFYTYQFNDGRSRYGYAAIRTALVLTRLSQLGPLQHQNQIPQQHFILDQSDLWSRHFWLCS